jgi:hypothetical protein
MYDLFIAPFAEFEFMRRALVGMLALSFGAAPIGVFLMLRRMSLTGDAMAHAILPGAALGFLVAGFDLFAMTFGGIHPKIHDFESCASTSSATLASKIPSFFLEGGKFARVSVRSAAQADLPVPPLWQVRYLPCFATAGKPAVAASA